MPKLKKALKDVRLAGYAAGGDEEDEPAFRCVAAPISDESGVVAAVSVVGTTEPVGEDHLNGSSRRSHVYQSIRAPIRPFRAPAKSRP